MNKGFLLPEMTDEGDEDVSWSDRSTMAAGDCTQERG